MKHNNSHGGFTWRAVGSGTLLRASKTRFTVLVLLLILSMQACGGSSEPQPCGTGEVGIVPHCFPAPPAPPAQGKTWHLVFSEDFDGNDYDRTKLSPCFDWNHGACTSSFNKGEETYRPEQVRVSDGTAKLVAEPLSAPEPNDACHQESCNYKSGLLSTARPNVNDSQYPLPFTYGYVESRMKFPAVPGFFTAFWMVPSDPTFDYRSEIDIVEILGSDPTSVFMTYAHNDRTQLYKVNKQPQDNGSCPVRDYSRDWVRFGVNWQPDQIAWYIDGIKCGEFSDAAQIENGPMQLILDLMVNTNWARDVNSVVPHESPVAQLEVDYIRVYQQH